jgi:hypothetical protein
LCSFLGLANSFTVKSVHFGTNLKINIVYFYSVFYCRVFWSNCDDTYSDVEAKIIIWEKILSILNEFIISHHRKSTAKSSKYLKRTYLNEVEHIGLLQCCHLYLKKNRKTFFNNTADQLDVLHVQLSHSKLAIWEAK